MSSHLVFRMGQFEARFPTERRYATNHMWVRETGPGTLRCGFSAYAVRLMLDVYFLEWHIEAGTAIERGQEIGAIESKKAESSLYAPLAGELQQFNQELLTDPSAINLDNYGVGWLFDIEGPFADTMTAAEYLEFLAIAWEKTRRNLRGQLG